MSLALVWQLLVEGLLEMYHTLPGHAFGRAYGVFCNGKTGNLQPLSRLSRSSSVINLRLFSIVSGKLFWRWFEAFRAEKLRPTSWCLASPGSSCSAANRTHYEVGVPVLKCDWYSKFDGVQAFSEGSLRFPSFLVAEGRCHPPGYTLS